MVEWLQTILLAVLVWLGFALKNKAERIRFDLWDFFSTWKKTDPYYRRAVAEITAQRLEELAGLNEKSSDKA